MLARQVLKITKWLWPVVLVPLAIALIPLFIQAKQGDFLYVFLAPGPVRTTSLAVLALLLLIPFAAWLVTLVDGDQSNNKLLREYLRAVVSDNTGLSPTGIAPPPSAALISINVPLSKIFIHLRADAKRPVHDILVDREKALDELRQRLENHPERREEFEEYRARLWEGWLAEQTRGLAGVSSSRNEIEDVVSRLTAQSPCAILLGHPGSGKSTTMRWLALSMAQACLVPARQQWLNSMLRLLSRVLRRELPRVGYQLPTPLAPAQIPLLLRISDYAKQRDRPQVGELSFQDFLTEHLAYRYPRFPGLAQRLLQEIEQGHCLLLFDGLDEVADEGLRRAVASAISQFIRDYRPEKPDTKIYNRFLITSRRVGYNPAPFTSFAEYTLLDLEREQIEAFLANWCPAVEAYMMEKASTAALSAPQRDEAQRLGDLQREKLLTALNHSPGVERLAANPLTLTILALIQRSGKTLPQRRIELYQVVTRTLLDNWNRERGTHVFSPDKVKLAEFMLADLAYEQHRRDRMLTEREVKTTVCAAMDAFHQRPPGSSSAEAAQEFIDEIRNSSGLFAEAGSELFTFLHRTFQEYYASLYLLRKPPDDFKRFITEHASEAIWHEPLLLAIAAKSEAARNEQEKQEVSSLIRAILNTGDVYDAVLQRPFLLAARCLADCSPSSIIRELQQEIANALFDLYGDNYGSGRYTTLQQEIEQAMLFWLRVQSEGDSRHDEWPPLLETWRAALRDPRDAQRQEGSVHLLASLARDLPSCPPPVLQALVPALLQLAGIEDWYRRDLTSPPEIRAQLFRFQAQVARPCSQRIEDYALVTLRLLDDAGPAGWLHSDWLRWNASQHTRLTGAFCSPRQPSPLPATIRTGTHSTTSPTPGKLPRNVLQVHCRQSSYRQAAACASLTAISISKCWIRRTLYLPAYPGMSNGIIFSSRKWPQGRAPHTQLA